MLTMLVVPKQHTNWSWKRDKKIPGQSISEQNIIISLLLTDTTTTTTTTSEAPHV